MNFQSVDFFTKETGSLGETPTAAKAAKEIGNEL